MSISSSAGGSCASSCFCGGGRARCCSGTVRGVWASPDELTRLKGFFVSWNDLRLRCDMPINGEFFHQGALLVQAGRFRRDRSIGARWDEVVLAKLQAQADKRKGLMVAFEDQPIAQPWRTILHWPCFVLWGTVAAVLALIVVGTGGGSLSLDTSFDSFMESDSESSLRYISFHDAMISNEKGAQKSRRLEGIEVAEPQHSPSHGRRLGTKYRLRSFQLTYVSTDGTSLLRTDVLSAIHEFENEVRALPAFKELCSNVNPAMQHMCSSGVSFANFLYPWANKSLAETQLFLDGSGSEAQPLSYALRWAQQSRVIDYVLSRDLAGKQPAFDEAYSCGDVVSGCQAWKEDGKCDSPEHELYMQDFCAFTCELCDDPQTVSGESVTSLRSFFSFEFRLGDASASRAVLREGVEKLEEVYPRFLDELSALLSEHSVEGASVFWNGDGRYTYEAFKAFGNDLTWAALAYAFVMVYATIHTVSLLLASVGLLLVMLSIPAAVAVFCMASGSSSISLLMCLSIFIVIGVGSDMLFVYTDFWKQSSIHSHNPEDRLKFVYSQASASTAATTFTTAASFLANLASVLRPLREFGFFMGVCVSIAWLLVLAAYPAVLIIGDRCHRRLRRNVMPRSTFIAQYDRPSLLVRLSTSSSQLLDGKPQGMSLALSGFLSTHVAGAIHRMRFLIVVFFFGMTGLSMWSAAGQFEQDSEAPQLFGSEHDLHKVRHYDGIYHSYDRNEFAPFQDMRASKCADLASSCDSYQCNTVGRREGSGTNCSCMPYGQWAKAGVCPNSVLKVRVIGRANPAPQVSADDIKDLAAQWYPNATIAMGEAEVETRQIETSHWESGKTYTASVLVMPTMVVTGNQAYTLSGFSALDPECHMTEVCYCGVERCWETDAQLPSFRPQVHLEPRANGVSSRARLLSAAPPAAATSFKVTASQRASVVLVFGLTVNGSSPVLGEASEQPFAYVGSFRLEDPWAQRQALELCTTFPVELLVTDVTCWLVGLQEWWEGEGGSWPFKPHENFHEAAYWYAQNHRTNDRETTKFVWFDDQQRVRAMWTQAQVDISRSSATRLALESKAKWDQHLSGFNALAPASIAGAWHTSRLWVRAEAEEVIVNSTIITLAIALGCVMGSVLAFTRSMQLALIVMFTVSMVMMSLFFFMVVVMDWKIGAIEVLSLIVFVGFAVDYCLHIAHKFHSCQITGVVEEQHSDDEEGCEQSDKPLRQSVSGLRKKSLASPDSTARRTATSVRLLPFRMTLGPANGRQARASRVSMRLQDTIVSSEASEQQKTSLTMRRKHKNEERFDRARYALEKMGSSVIGSALTTLGCSLFLLPCSLHVFFKIGAVVCGVTLYAVFFGLLFLPAVLMIMGPAGHDFQACWKLDMKDWDEVGFDAGSREAQRPPRSSSLYVLNMPIRGMGARGHGQPASRTRIVATG